MADTEANTKSTRKKSPGYDLGILLVHGIGEQPRGDTLARFGEPIIHWIKCWVGEAGTVNIEETYLEEGDTEDEGPAHFVAVVNPNDKLWTEMGARIKEFLESKPQSVDEDNVWDFLSGPAPTAVHSQKWMMAESWWASHFRRPSFGTFARWLLSRGPWVILFHFGSKVREANGWQKGIGVHVVSLCISICDSITDRRGPFGYTRHHSLAAPAKGTVRLTAHAHRYPRGQLRVDRKPDAKIRSHHTDESRPPLVGSAMR